MLPRTTRIGWIGEAARPRSVFALTGLIFLLSSEAFAAGGGGHHVPSIADLGRYWVNFFIFFGTLFYLLKKPVQAAWVKRRAQIAEGVERANRELSCANEQLDEAEQRLRKADAHAEEMTRRVEVATAAEAEEIVREARRKAEAIKEQARQSALAEGEAARRGLREEIVELALARAVELSKAQLSPERDRKIRESALKGVPLLLQ